MNRPGLLATALLHGLALWAWRGLGDPHGPRAAPLGHPSVAVRLLPAAASPHRLHATMPPPPRPLTPLRIEPLEVVSDPVVRERASATIAPLPQADHRPQEPSEAQLPLREDLARSAPAPSLSPSPSPRTAWVPATLPPDHQACRAQQAERHYPALLRDRGIEGRVVVRVMVDEAGRAAEVQVQSASGWRLLDEAARRVAAACPYQPARQGEQRLAAWIEYPIRFSLH